MPGLTRRRVLAMLAAVGGSGALAGCGETFAADETESGGLDRREANVAAVRVTRDGGGHRFAVTVVHDDANEPGYADYWVVESLNGTVLGRRDTLGEHQTARFTLSATVTLPRDVTCVVVRAHDQTHGFGGQAIVVNVESRAQRVVRQGGARRAVDATECPD
jgi:hypothetical protein